MASKTLKIMFLGAPGAGKGTYASRIAPMLQIPTISTGDLVRHEIKTGTALGDKIKKRLALDDAKPGFILDGFPRNVPQAEAFQKVATLDLVVNIDLPQWILSDKISGRRCANEACNRGKCIEWLYQTLTLEVYNQETAPLIDFYTDVGCLRTFEVKKGLADLDKLVELIKTELDV
ncbi:hypothetical protein BBJ28_00002140 [Nothophytophthora sp. Chile5]|nr:hypothetical protein BBJ28_00002140 [Nothophytophthora sp. Chile5]